MAGLTGTLVLKRLRRAIAKVSFLLSFRATRWLLVRSGSRLSFRDGQGLLAFLPSEDHRNSNVSEYFDAATSPTPSDSSSPSPGLQQRQLSRANSSTWTGVVLNRTLSGVSPTPPIVISRTSSDEEEVATLAPAGSMSRAESGVSSSGDDDVDRKATEFIRKFRKHLEIERTVSLELRYVRKDSSDSSTSS